MTWKNRAECIGEDPDIFFEYLEHEKAVKLCQACEVRFECLSYAVENRIRDGFWGGVKWNSRRKLTNKSNLIEFIEKYDRYRNRVWNKNNIK
jgi:WhiB family transcriptional regulator, redox-sensing transcriptional regulator|tara:strand:- start:33 stop:308 length:276 start_codon:yes stop_codon:yes gene_type:complete